MNKEEFVDKNQLANMTKKELVDTLYSTAMQAETYKLRCQTAIEDSDRSDEEAGGLRREIETMQTKLDKAEAYVEQGRAMINAVMERWYEYDA